MKTQYILISVIIATLNTSVSFADEIKPFWTLQQQGQASLEKQYKNKIAEDPDEPQAYSHLAGLYLINNKTTEAIDAYQDAITRNPEDPRLFAAISIAYLHQSRYAMAKAMADEALRIDPTLKQVEKINEYIIAKKAAIDEPPKTSSDANYDLKKTAMKMPSDTIHGAEENLIKVDNLDKWTNTQH